MSPSVTSRSSLRHKAGTHTWMIYQTLSQVWFSGMHTDVGGGYSERGLSDIPLVWLIDKAIDHGLRIYRDHMLDIKPDPLEMMHDSRGNG
jgi:hypothetical protein